MPLTLLAWKPLNKNTLRGFATVRLGKALSIKDITLHASHGKRWASLPSKPMMDAGGNVKKNDQGKVQYVPILEWLDRETADKFSEGVIEAVEREHPGATGL